MNIKEFEKLADAIKTYFPRENIFPTKESARLWYEELKDLDYQMAAMELRKYVSLNRFSPAIADIRECLIDFAEWKEPDAPQAWELVIEALKKVEESGHAKKKFEALPELTRKAIGGYALFLELSDNQGAMQVSKTNFMKSYAKLLEKKMEMKKLQPEIRHIMEQRKTAGQIEQKGGADKIGLEEVIGDELADF